MLDTRTISIEFCLATLLLLSIFIINIFHILYLIIYNHNKQIKSIRLILINSSSSSLIVSLWLIPFFYFRTIWSSESILWRLWTFAFHIVDAVQLYSLLLLITTRSCQRIFIGLIWLIPIITYSPLLWLTSSGDTVDYLPYRRLTTHVPWWILPILYFSMYFIPIIISLVLSSVHICWPLIYYYYKKQKKILRPSSNDHHKDMAELTNLIETVFNFQLEQSKTKSNTFNTWISPLNQSLAHKICQQESFFLFDELSTYSLVNNSPANQVTKTKTKTLNSCTLCIITCLYLLVHLPYILLSLFDMSTLQLSIFIYIHWFGTLFLPMIHIK